MDWPRLWAARNFSLAHTGVEQEGMVRTAGRYILLTSLSYVFVQALALLSGTCFAALHTLVSTGNAAVLVLVVCLGFFAYYVYLQFRMAPKKAGKGEVVLEEVTKCAL